MAYTMKYDDNGNPVGEGLIDGFKRVDIATTSVGIFDVQVPKGSFQVTVKRCPVKAEIQYNDSDFIPLDEGDMATPFYKLETIKIDIKQIGTEPIVLIFTI